jgi:hypothetical protein
MRSRFSKRYDGPLLRMRFVVIEVQGREDFLQFTGVSGVFELDLSPVTPRQRTLGPALRSIAASLGSRCVRAKEPPAPLSWTSISPGAPRTRLSSCSDFCEGYAVEAKTRPAFRLPRLRHSRIKWSGFVSWRGLGQPNSPILWLERALGRGRPKVPCRWFPVDARGTEIRRSRVRPDRRERVAATLAPWAISSSPRWRDSAET